MLENSFIQEVKLPNAKPVYELTKETHSHLVCKKCDSVKDITINLESVIADISQSSTFKITSTDLVLSGLCKNCK